jgi:hypothetical protein
VLSIYCRSWSLTSKGGIALGCLALLKNIPGILSALGAAAPNVQKLLLTTVHLLPTQTVSNANLMYLGTLNCYTTSVVLASH